MRRKVSLSKLVFAQFLFVASLVFSVPGFSLCTFRIADGDDFSGMREAIQSAFGVDVNEAKVDFTEKSDGCTFILTSSKVRKNFEVSTKECRNIKLIFELNLVGLICHSLELTKPILNK